MTKRETPLTMAAAAKLFDKDQRTLRRWVQAGAPHRKRDGRVLFQLAELIPWREAQRLQTEDASPVEAKERARKLRAEASIAELRHEEMRGALVPAADVEATWERTLGILDARINAIRGKWTPKLLGITDMIGAAKVLDELVTELRATLYAAAEELEADEEAIDGEDVA